jgi:outer membrane protein OmpA-like peptidoglycan-associated protein
MTVITSTRLARVLLLGTALITLGACTSMGPNAQITDAQGRLSAALNDKDTAERGQGDLDNAKLALNSAQMEWTRGDREKAEHQLIMGQTYLDLAETRGQQAKFEADNTRLTGLALIADKDRQLAAKTQQLQGKDEQIAGQDKLIAGKNDELAQKTQELAKAQDQLRDYNMTNNDMGSTMVLQDVSFETGKSQLLAGGVNRLQPLINYLRLSPMTKVRIEGYTDNVGGADYNQTLSLARANAVKTILATGGVGGERILTAGSGVNKPVATNATAEGRQSNRRVEITLLKQPGT